MTNRQSFRTFIHYARRRNITMHFKNVPQPVLILPLAVMVLFALALVSSTPSLASSVSAVSVSSPLQQAGSVDWAAVDQAMGKAGAMQPGAVYRYSLPRSDLQVTLGGVQLKA